MNQLYNLYSISISFLFFFSLPGLGGVGSEKKTVEEKIPTLDAVNISEVSLDVNVCGGVCGWGGVSGGVCGGVCVGGGRGLCVCGNVVSVV